MLAATLHCGRRITLLIRAIERVAEAIMILGIYP